MLASGTPDGDIQARVVCGGGNTGAPNIVLLGFTTGALARARWDNDFRQVGASCDGQAEPTNAAWTVRGTDVGRYTCLTEESVGTPRAAILAVNEQQAFEVELDCSAAGLAVPDSTEPGRTHGLVHQTERGFVLAIVGPQTAIFAGGGPRIRQTSVSTGPGKRCRRCRNADTASSRRAAARPRERRNACRSCTCHWISRFPISVLRGRLSLNRPCLDYQRTVVKICDVQPAVSTPAAVVPWYSRDPSGFWVIRVGPCRPSTHPVNHRRCGNTLSGGWAPARRRCCRRLPGRPARASSPANRNDNGDVRPLSHFPLLFLFYGIAEIRLGSG